MGFIERAVRLLRDGRLVAFPTETVYGLGADATNAQAIERIYATKGRPGTNPLIVHVAEVGMARRVAAEWPEATQKLAERFWPGPLTMVLAKHRAGAGGGALVIPDNATAGLGTVGVRIPSRPLALELLRAFGGALAAPSANRSLRVSPTTAAHVLEEYPESAAAGGASDLEPAMLLDGGACEVGIESTVLDLSGEQAVILRPGQVTAAQIEEVIGPVKQRQGAASVDQASASPGQQEVHYSPATPTYRFLSGHVERIGAGRHGVVVLSSIAGPKLHGTIVSMPSEPELYAKRLYAVLRELDLAGLEAIFIEMPPDEARWAAIRDRLGRASRPIESFMK